MYKVNLLSVFLIFMFFAGSLAAHGQSFTESKKGLLESGYAQAIFPQLDASEAINHEGRITNSSVCSSDWLFGSRNRSKAERASNSKRPEQRVSQTPPARSESKKPTEHKDRRRRPSGTTNADFIQNVPSEPIQPSLRDQHTKVGIWELGILLGTSHGITDIQNNKYMKFGDFVDYQVSNFDYSFGIFTRYMAANWFALNGGMKYARLSGVDKPPSDSEFESFSFENNLFEFFIKTEFHAPFLENTASKAYLFSGVSLYFTEVSVKDADGMIYQITDDFEQIQPAFPFGIGYSYTFRNFISIGYEFGWRYTPFHYLDGVSPDQRRYDSYFFNLITLSYPLVFN